VAAGGMKQVIQMNTTKFTKYTFSATTAKANSDIVSTNTGKA